MRRALILCVLLAACGDDDPAPTVAIIEVTPDALIGANDAANDVGIRVAYRDADGDLGEGAARIHDCRDDDLATILELPAIASAEAVEERVTIAGELLLTVADVGFVAPGGEPPAVCADLGVDANAPGTVRFCVELVDAAGHVGPGACTDAIAVSE